MTRWIVRWAGLTLGTLGMAILIGLGILYYNVGKFADYWQGRGNKQGDFLYVALGDSAAQGIGASQPQNGYVGLIADSIGRKTGRTVRVVNLSVTGATLEDALRSQTPKLADFTPDLVTAEIGANDMGKFDSTKFATEYELFLQSLPPARSVVSNMPYFGTRPQPNANAAAANAIIYDKTKRYGVPMADLYGSLRTRQSPLIYASDLFHPNNRGYQIWYDAFWPQVEPLLAI